MPQWAVGFHPRHGNEYVGVIDDRGHLLNFADHAVGKRIIVERVVDGVVEVDKTDTGEIRRGIAVTIHDGKRIVKRAGFRDDDFAGIGGLDHIDQALTTRQSVTAL